MNANEKYAKLLALSVLYEKEEQARMTQVQNITCRPTDVQEILNDIIDTGFRDWVVSVSHLFKTK